MAKTAKFKFKDLSFETSFEKVDRKKVYGYSKIEVKDKDGNVCQLANITSDGRYILPSGSTGVMTFDNKGNYISRSDMKVVNDEGEEVEKILSVFDRDVVELEEATIEEYLDLNVKAIYQLNVEDNLDGLLAELNSGKLFKFEYNYRTDHDADDAFLLSAEDTAFMVIGDITSFDFVGLDSKIEELVVEEEEEDDDLDMSMF